MKPGVCHARYMLRVCPTRRNTIVHHPARRPGPSHRPSPVPPALTSEEIVTLSLPSESTAVHHPETPPAVPTKRICLQSTDTQRKTHNSHLFGKPKALSFCLIAVEKQYIFWNKRTEFRNKNQSLRKKLPELGPFWRLVKEYCNL